MDEKLKEIKDYYDALDADVENGLEPLNSKIISFNKRRELSDYDRSIVEDITTLLNHEMSHAVARDAFKDAISLVSEITLGLRKIKNG